MCNMKANVSTMREDEAVQDKNISARLPGPLVDRLDALAEKERRSRSAMMMLLLEEALDAREGTA